MHDRDFEALLRASSLGSPAAMRVQSHASATTASEILERCDRRAGKNRKRHISAGTLPAGDGDLEIECAKTPATHDDTQTSDCE
jgi:hypothetical protein